MFASCSPALGSDEIGPFASGVLRPASGNYSSRRRGELPWNFLCSALNTPDVNSRERFRKARTASPNEKRSDAVPFWAASIHFGAEALSVMYGRSRG